MRVEREHNVLSLRHGLRARRRSAPTRLVAPSTSRLGIAPRHDPEDFHAQAAHDPRLAPVAFVGQTVPRAAEGGKAIEDKGRGKAEAGQEAQDTSGEGGSGGRSGGREEVGALPCASITE